MSDHVGLKSSAIAWRRGGGQRKVESQARVRLAFRDRVPAGDTNGDLLDWRIVGLRRFGPARTGGEKDGLGSRQCNQCPSRHVS